MMSKDSRKDLGIYIHIPYCIKKCPYCAFSSFAVSSVPGEYVNGLLDEIKWSAETFGTAGRRVDTVYFGGGTPSMQDAGDVERILDALAAHYEIAGDAEVTLEVNPAVNDLERLRSYRRSGVNRLSIGVQSFSVSNLRFLGRAHDRRTAEEAFGHAREAGFENISIDIIFALPGQTMEDLLADIETGTGLSPEHISLYILGLEAGTPMTAAADKGAFTPADDKGQEEMFLAAADILRGKGYLRYETSNYAKEGFQSRHNMRYWQGGDYLGLGAGAHSYDSSTGWGMRWWGISDPAVYMKSLKEGRLPVDGLEVLTRLEAVREAVITSLRTARGLDGRDLVSRFGLSLYEVLSRSKVEAFPPGYFTVKDGGLVLTDRGALVADGIAEALSF